MQLYRALRSALLARKKPTIQGTVIMRNTSSAIRVGNKTYKTNEMIKRVSEEINLLGSRLEEVDSYGPCSSEQQGKIVDMIKIRCELLGSLSKSFD